MPSLPWQLTDSLLEKMAPRSGPLREYLAARCHPEPNSGCWIWLKALNGKGYGVFNRGGRGEGNIKAHQASFEEYKGPRGNLNVLHRCHNRCCINPDHLYLGTQADNVRDMMAANRGRNQYSAQLVATPV